MAGHSKWANIRFKKERADVKKGKIYSRSAKEIISAVKVGGGADPKGNPRLRAAIDKARANNVPNDIIERNIKKAASSDQADYSEMTYELYGHGSVGIVVDILTDNKNRIASEIRIATNKKGGTVATPGAVAYNFDRKGVIQVARAGNVSEEALFSAALDAGAEDFENEDEELFIITSDPAALAQVKNALEAANFAVVEASLAMIPKTMVTCDDDTSSANHALIEWLESIDDVDAVYHNMS